MERSRAGGRNTKLKRKKIERETLCYRVKERGASDRIVNFERVVFLLMIEARHASKYLEKFEAQERERDRR